MKTDDFYTDETKAISESTKTCPKCGSSIEPNIYATLRHVPDARYMVCGACEVQLVFIRPGDVVKYPDIKQVTKKQQDIDWYEAKVIKIDGKRAFLCDIDSKQRIRCDVDMLRFS